MTYDKNNHLGGHPLPLVIGPGVLCATYYGVIQSLATMETIFEDELQQYYGNKQKVLH